DHSSGFFPMGTSTVKVTATDASTNVSTGSFTVTVVDTTPPTLAVPANVVATATTPTGATVTLPQATVTDLVDANPVVTYDHSSGFSRTGSPLPTSPMARPWEPTSSTPWPRCLAPLSTA